MLRFVGDGDQKKFTKNPRHFSMQNSQANTKKIFTTFFWRAGKITNPGKDWEKESIPSGKKKQHKHKLCGPDFPRTFLTLTSGCPGVKKFLPTTGAAGKPTFWCGRPRFSARTSMTRTVVEKLFPKKVCVDFLAPIPSRPKVLQKILFKNNCFGAISFVKNYKTISLQSKFLRMFSCEQGQTSGSNITKQMFWWNYFCNNY